MKLNNKGEAYTYVILGIIILAFVMVFGFNYKKFIPKVSSDTTYKELRDSVIKAGKNYVVANDYSILENYEETTFTKKETNGLDRNLNCEKDNIDCKKIAINTLIKDGYLKKLVDINNQKECDTKDAYLVIAKVMSNNAQKDYNYYYKIENLKCGNKRLVNTSNSEYYVVEK